MIRNLKMLGLALVAVCAIGAVAASAASANSNYWFTAPGSDWTVLSGEEVGATPYETKFDGEISGNPVGMRCERAGYSGSETATTFTTITLGVTLTNCEMLPLGKWTISFNGCSYVIHTDPLGDTTNGAYDTVTTIDCPAGKEITAEIKAAGILKCMIHIEAQNLGTGIVLRNKAGGGFEATINFANLKYTQTEGTGVFKCSTTTTTSNGVWTGAATITGKNTFGAAVAINAST